MTVPLFQLSRPGWGSYLGIPVNEPCPFQQIAAPKGVGLVSRGKDIHQAAKEGNVGAVRHFLRVDPRAWRGRRNQVMKTTMHSWAAASERKLETSVKMSDPVIHAAHKLGMFW